MDSKIREYLAELGRIGGARGTGPHKARTPEQYVARSEAYWLEHFLNAKGNRHAWPQTNMHEAIPGRKNTGRQVLVCGCNKSEFMRHMERQFYPCPYGGEFMDWGNKCRWHVDHIISRDAFDTNDPFQMLECWHWTNLRPLWEGENWSKGKKILHVWRYPYSERKKWTVAGTFIDSAGMTAPLPTP